MMKIMEWVVDTFWALNDAINVAWNATALWIKIAIVAIAAALIIFAFTVGVKAHIHTAADGSKVDARWIMNDKKTAYCCGPADCKPVRLMSGKRGYFVPGWKGYIAPGSSDLHRKPTPDGADWACYRTKWVFPGGGKMVQEKWIRCAFPAAKF